MSLNQSLISDFSQNIHADLKGPKVKYKLHYGWCTGRRFTAATKVAQVSPGLCAQKMHA